MAVLAELARKRSSAVKDYINGTEARRVPLYSSNRLDYWRVPKVFWSIIHCFCGDRSTR